MYLSHQSRQLIHQDVVNDSLQRAECRRMLRESRSEVGREAKTRSRWAALQRTWRLRWSQA